MFVQAKTKMVVPRGGPFGGRIFSYIQVGSIRPHKDSNVTPEITKNSQKLLKLHFYKNSKKDLTTL